MLKNTFQSDFNKLKNLYHTELREYISFNRQLTIKLLFYAFPLLLTSIILFMYSSVKQHIVPLHIILGTMSLYFFIMAIIHQIDSFKASHRINSKVDSYLSKFEQIKLRTYCVDNEYIESYCGTESETRILWSELISIVKKKQYFCLYFRDGKSFFIPVYAVEPAFFDQFLQLANGKIKPRSFPAMRKFFVD